ncbi:MAG: formylglycine-generating enzyme family protein [Pirellulales bacterium]
MFRSFRSFAPFALAVTATLVSHVAAAEPTPVGMADKAPPPGVQTVKTDLGWMVPYTVKLSDKVSIDMIPIPGGKFKLGSPAGENGRNADEGPQVEVEVGPCWIAKTETTWGQYMIYMSYERIFKDPDGKQAVAVSAANQVDAVTAPSALYEPTYTFEHGEDPQLPAVTMSSFGARQFTKWLSKKTGQTFRLPNEVEWEHAARAGTTTAYGFGDDAKSIGDYAWTSENSGEKPHKVGTKKPNAWGLHDMHGNVMEWTLDAYAADAYAKLAKNTGKGLALTNWPTELFPRVLRGGSFEFDAGVARSAARFQSDDEKWHDTDPNRPKSPWWLTDDPARSVGFRVVRTLAPLTPDEAKHAYEVDNDKTKASVEKRLDEGRGSNGVVGKE